MYPSIKTYCRALEAEFKTIPADRKKILDQIADYIHSKVKKSEFVNLLYVCTHNSRRSHFGQIWAKVASDYYTIPKVKTYSGGTETTEFNKNAINTLIRVGFKVESIHTDPNNKYSVSFGETEEPLICFSKVYNDAINPKENFAAIMTCGEAEENCPLIPGVDLRIATTYEDPKRFDETELVDLKYDERCKHIALETFYIFSTLNKSK